MVKYSGEYIVTGKLLDNMYFLCDLIDQNELTIATNVRQMTLLHKGSSPTVESLTDTDEESSNIV